MKTVSIQKAILLWMTVFAVSADAAVAFMHYRLDETSGTTATDSGSQGADGAYQGTYTQGVAGPFGTAVDFNGVDGEIFKSSFPALNNLTHGFTMSAWVQPDTVAGTQRIFSNDGGGDGWGFGLSGDELLFTTYGIQDFTSSGAGIAADTFTHVAVTFNENYDAEFFVNGNSIGSVSGASGANVASGNWFLASTGTGERFDGSLDEFHLYDSVLSQTDIQQLTQNNIIVPEASTLALAGIGGILMVFLRGKQQQRRIRGQV